jgi:serine protease Do
MRTPRPSLLPVTDAVGNALVTLELDGRSAAGFLVGDADTVVCNLHTVVGATSIIARLHDGRRVVVRDVANLDALRDLCVLRLDEVPLHVEPLWVGDDVAVPERGATVLTASGTAPDDALVATTVSDHQRAGERFAVFVLNATLPAEAAGAPVLDVSGAVLGVLTIARSAEGVVNVGIPARHLAPLLAERRGLGFESLALPARRRSMIPREVPEHPLSLLDAMTPRDVEALARPLVEAIQEGAPAYNRGDATLCWAVYARAAAALAESPRVPTPVRDTLAESLDRARALTDDDARAWALRDCFDGLLAVIERWAKTRARSSQAPAISPDLSDPFAPRPRRWVN